MFKGVVSLSLMTMNDRCKTTELLSCILGVVLSGQSVYSCIYCSFILQFVFLIISATQSEDEEGWMKGLMQNY